MRFSLRWPAYVVPALVMLCTAQSPAQVPTEPPPPVCSRESIVSMEVGPTIRQISPGRRIVAIVWHLSDHHTYVSQTGDATDELKPAGTVVQLCENSGDIGPYAYLIRTKDGTNRAAKRTA